MEGSRIAPIQEEGQPTDLLKTREVARRLGVDRSTVLRWIRENSMEAVTIRRGKRPSYRIRRATLDARLTATTFSQMAVPLEGSEG